MTASTTGAADLQPQLDPTHLAVVRYPPQWQPPTADVSGFFAMVRAQQEVTVVASESLLDQAEWAATAIEIDRAWRRVTFPGPLPWEQVGFLADVATRLAAAQIPFTSMSGFTTDHVLVRAAQADLAVTVLSGHEPPAPRLGVNP